MVDGLRNHDRQCERCQGSGLIFVGEDDEPPKVEEEPMEAMKAKKGKFAKKVGAAVKAMKA